MTAIAAVVGLAIIGVVDRHSIMIGGLAWFVVLFFVFSGWGYLLARVTRTPDPDVALRAVWGASALLLCAGLLLAIERCNATALQALVAIGLAGFIWRELVTPVPLVVSARALIRAGRTNPGWTALVIALLGLAVFQMIGAVARTGSNVWDDDVAYNAFLRRLLDLGEMNEPFSFRRLSAYGGQIILNALAAVRGSSANVFVVEQGLFLGLTVLLTIAAARARKIDPVWQALVVALLLLLPDTSINTASYWTGAAGFIALYRTILAIDASDGVTARRYGAIAAIVGSAICTLRQNYVPVVVFFLAFFLARRLVTAARSTTWREAWHRERGLVLISVAVATFAIVPYCVAAFRANHSFMFPIMAGTWNRGLQLTPVLWSVMQELEFFVWCCIEPHGLIVVIPLFCVLVFARDTRGGGPLMALFFAICLSFILLVHSFTSSDPLNLWRYAFGYAVALAVMLMVEVAPSRIARHVVVNWVARWVVLCSIVIQLFETRLDLRWKLRTMTNNIRASWTADLHPGKAAGKLQQHYAALQQSIPPGAKVMTMLDAAANLDFTRNELFILDMPGWSSLPPGYPSFGGPSAIRQYLTSLGIRYLAFVRSEQSVALYRRDGWLQRLFSDVEVSQIMGAYLVDTIDSFSALARSCKVLYDEDAFVALDLEACR